MSTINKSLNRLYQLVEASEKGYAVAACSVNNQAIKVLFKSYAKKRATFKEEIWAEMQRLGSTVKPASSILGAIHRGRVTIFAVMTIGEENIERVVLKEVLLGEKVARYYYERILKKDLPETTRAIVQKQYEDVQQLVEQAQSMLGKNGKKLIIWLYDAEKDADKAVNQLKTSGYAIQSIQKHGLSASQMYTEKSIKVSETALSGAVGGAIWATIGGLLVL
ncbi:MAG: PA2169 family four-helix-bundle protein [Anaerolineales bacterium]|nr:PA2169 family four-helix-bundle protein [Anaerolineales bacterium]